MDRTNKRLSLSTSNLLSPPIAESTHISQQKFPWGSGLNKSPVNYKKNDLSRNSNNNNNVIDQKSLAKNNSTKIFTSKIDAKVYTDAQSRGLASRIVRYHDNNLKLNRCLSMTNLYNKPGQFPVVHLKKTKLPVKSNRHQSNVSVIKIAPPVRSIFRANSRASILRSCSAVGILEKSTELSHDDRPILHPNETEQNGTPTRSVLEVLKEISRKRINSDELDLSTDNIKKYCRESNIVLENNQNNNDIDGNIQDNTRNTLACSKRQREMSYSPNSSNSNWNKSPEQISSKRRLYACSNDISSSLSSSLSMITPKRKILLDDETSGHYDQKTKSQKQMYDVDRKMCSNKSLKITESSKTSLKDECDGTENLNVSLESVKNIAPPPVSKAISEPIIKTNEPAKPKLTLFNKNYSTNCIPVVQDDFDDENGKVSFVKPKKSSLKLARNSLIEKAQKSKLALMLSSLRGDLHDEDDIDSVEQKLNGAEIIVEPSKQECIKAKVEISSSSAYLGSTKSTQNQTKVTENDKFIVPKSVSVAPIVIAHNIPKSDESSAKTAEFSLGVSSANVASNISKPIASVTAIIKLPTNTNVDPSTVSTISTNSFTGISSIGLNTIDKHPVVPTLTGSSILMPNSPASVKTSTYNAATTTLKEPIKITSLNETLQAMAAAKPMSAFSTISSSSVNSPQLTNATNKIIEDKPITTMGQNSSLFSFGTSQTETINAIPKSSKLLNNSAIIFSSEQVVPSNVSVGFKGPEFVNESNKKDIGGFSFGLDNSKVLSFGNNTSKNNNNGNDEPLKSIGFPSAVPLFNTKVNPAGSIFDSKITAAGSKNALSAINVAANDESKTIQPNIKDASFSFTNDKTPIFGNSTIDSTKPSDTTTKNTPFAFGMNSQNNATFNTPIFGNNFNQGKTESSNLSDSFNFTTGNAPAFGNNTNQFNIIENTPNTFKIDGNNDGKSLFGTNNEKSNISEASSKTNDFTFGGIKKGNNVPVFGNTNNFGFASSNENTFAFGSNNTKQFSFAENDQNKAITEKPFNFNATSSNVQSADKPFSFGVGTPTEAFKFGEDKPTAAGAEKSFTFADKSSLSNDKGFAFGDNNKPANLGGANSFTFGDKSAPPAFSFNANAAQLAQPANSYSNTTVKSNQITTTNQEKPFNFGAPATQSFPFNGSPNINNQIQPSNSFNFMPPANTTGMTSNNLFAPAPGVPAERLIRKATRRLK